MYFAQLFVECLFPFKKPAGSRLLVLGASHLVYVLAHRAPTLEIPWQQLLVEAQHFNRGYCSSGVIWWQSNTEAWDWAGSPEESNRQRHLRPGDCLNWDIFDWTFPETGVLDESSSNDKCCFIIQLPLGIQSPLRVADQQLILSG